MGNASLDRLEERIGYHFRDQYLLECALTHSSYANEQKVKRYKDYERLEFLGDAVLEMVSSAFLYNKFPDKKEGELSKIRAALVCEQALSECARRLGLPECLRLGKGEEAGGGRNKDSILCDVTEAVIGAVYEDSGELEPARRFIMDHILADVNDLSIHDAKSTLQERVQMRGGHVLYRVLGESGPEHCKVYEAGVYIDGELAGTGTGRSKKAAEQQAAAAALRGGQ